MVTAVNLWCLARTDLFKLSRQLVTRRIISFSKHQQSVLLFYKREPEPGDPMTHFQPQFILHEIVSILISCFKSCYHFHQILMLSFQHYKVNWSWNYFEQESFQLAMAVPKSPKLCGKMKSKANAWRETTNKQAKSELGDILGLSLNSRGSEAG